MFAVVAAVIFFLHAFGVLDTTEDVNWVFLGVAFWALHFGVPFTVPFRRD
jgi:uncharacterized oligopeptide transporter (OPT) family protein